MEFFIEHTRGVAGTATEGWCTVAARFRVEVRRCSEPIDRPTRTANRAIPLGPVVRDAEVLT